MANTRTNPEEFDSLYRRERHDYSALRAATPAKEVPIDPDAPFLSSRSEVTAVDEHRDMNVVQTRRIREEQLGTDIGHLPLVGVVEQQQLFDDK